MFEEYNIQKYVHADDVLHRLGQKRIEAEHSVYDRTLATHLEYDDAGIHTKAPRIENLVCDAIEATAGVDDQIRRWQLRRAWFNEWVQTLNDNERYMITHWPQYVAQDLRDKAEEEIYQIETAVAYRCGYEPPEEQIEIPPDPAAGVDAMAAFFGDD